MHLSRITDIASIVILSVSLLCIKNVVDGCSGLQKCCAGFRWSEKEKQCIKCPTGRQGIDCSSNCRYPNFGDGCQELCVCDEIFCNAETGCTIPTTDAVSIGNTSQNITENEKRTYFFSACLAVSLFALLIVFLHSAFKISRKIKHRVIEQRESIVERETKRNQEFSEVNQIHIDYLSLRELSAGITNPSIADTFTTDGSEFTYIDVNTKKDNFYQNNVFNHLERNDTDEPN